MSASFPINPRRPIYCEKMWPTSDSFFNFAKQQLLIRKFQILESGVFMSIQISLE